MGMTGGNGVGKRFAERRKTQGGQVAILFALVFTFMFILFGMVVDFAHLVNNKINLQNAADMAAYSGAAWQAQLLTRLGHMNYRLRQNVKELSMRALVQHIRHNANFPRGSQFYSGPGSVPNVEQFMCQQAHGYVALSGLRYANDTNLCRNASPSTGGIPPIVIPPVIASFDPFAVAIANQIRAISEAADQECRAAANDNRILAQHLIDVYTARNDFHSGQIDQIAGWLNSLGGGDASTNRHPISQVAFETARRNLSLANRDGFKMEILTPSGNQYVKMNQFKLRASLFFFNFNVVGSGCVGQLDFIDFDNMIASKTKDQTIVTYFAVKLSSTPRMLFMPQRWVADIFPKLEAFSAAKPFGSRIGPDPVADTLMPVPNAPGAANRLVNFSFIPNDPLGMNNTKMMAYFDALMPFNGIGRPQGEQNTGWPEPGKSEDIRMALQAIRAPTLFDALMYTILPDPDRPQDYAEGNFASALYPDYMEAANTNNEVINMQNPGTPAYFPTKGVQKGAGWIPVSAPDTGARYGSLAYAQETPASHSVAVAVGLPEITENNATQFGFASRAATQSGWAPTGRPGRIGYGVKFIGFDALTRTLRVRNANGEQTPIANPPTGDPNVLNILH